MYLKYISGIILLALVLMGITCHRDAEEINVLYDKTWLHAVEEDSADVLVYRPNTYAFPPSRGRTGFGFDADGTFRLFSIAPTDGLEEHLGRWKKSNPNTIRVNFEGDEPEGFSLEIVEAMPELLKVKKISGTK